MKAVNEIFSAQEKLVFALRSLYEDFGYTRFPMRRFEEYALYLENKSFLKSESVLAFANANGKLMALKPDVTLSIVKHASAKAKGVEKLYYNENVYRLSQTDHEFSEIEQMGVEMLGEVDMYGMCEVLQLAVESMRAVSSEYVLEISHMGFAAGLMDAARLTDAEKTELFHLIRQKNSHELRAALAKMPISPTYAEHIAGLANLSGECEETLARAKTMVENEEMRVAVAELSRIYEVLSPLGLCDRLRVDFSLLNDLDYYNGLVFQGYVRDVPRVALSGGRYDPLTHKFGKKGGGIGFALYLGELRQLLARPADYDADVLVLYGKSEDAAAIFSAVKELRKGGVKVLVAPETANGSIHARKTMRFAQGSLQEVEVC